MNNPPHGPSAFDREREREYLEDQNRQRALHQQEELVQREREYNERQERDRQQREQHGPAAPHQSNTGSIPIHQPVASRLTGAMHSPGGLLSTHGGAPSSASLGAPSGPANAFGGPLHSDANRGVQHNPQTTAAQLQQHQGFGQNILGHNAAPSNVPLGVPGGTAVSFAGPLQQQQQQQQEAASRLQQIPFGPPITQAHQMQGAPALGQGGQQPILNDALSYLDQVKVQFADQPDVYNRFLDIMKDFKSQAIDTPGVINRVSELFAGHPNLIQGFNTFLPPGYRIECGTGNDPNTIRVTTPMGTTVQSITGGRALPDTAQGASNAAYYSAQRAGSWQQQPQHSIESPEAVFSPPNQAGGPAYTQNQAHPSYEIQQSAAAIHQQQQQRGVNQLTNAAATLGQPPRNEHTPTLSQVNMNVAGAQPGLEKRGPVEFNHAISYVNKIKNRFQDRPEIYKQFLEILQTYQRESKPIQDVYAQVTTLFNDAQDLLEDFKQFLPESAAQAKQQAAEAAERAAQLAGATQTPQASQGGRSEAKMPPVGNFAVPASNSKEKKRRNNGPAGSQANAVAESSARGGLGSGGPNNKRPKLHHPKTMAPDAPTVSPTLTPIIPEPLAPTSTSSATSEELAFFDRVKKYIANKSTMNEFLKLCNLFSQDLIDRNVLVHKVSNFIGGNPDLMNWFKAFVNYEGSDEVIDNRPKAPTGRVALSNCRGLGPSYRLLPKRERLKPCSGRDEMCNSVLNDDWASHPTWASEDSGFVAHRKNQFEEGLHRIEEERHDYDFNIEANAKVIQLLEPIGQSLLSMDPAERESFRMPLGLGGQSQAIYKRVLKKIYGDKGPDVAADLFRDPGAVLPVVLARLKQKDEEWRFTQREWEKVWHSQTQAMYLKSLDHMGIHVRQSDKKNFAAKHLVDAIKTKHEEQRRQRITKGRAPKHQFSYEFSDSEVVVDVLRVMVLYVTNSAQINSSNSERRRVRDFFEKFITTFFDIPYDIFRRRTASIERITPDDDLDDATPTELPNGRGRRATKKTDLRRGILDKGRNGHPGGGQKDDSASGSKESTPDVDSMVEDDIAETAEDLANTEVTNERWAAAPGAVATTGTKALTAEEVEMRADQPFKREWYSLYGNQNIFVFFSIFQTLYRRFSEIKDSEEDAVLGGIRSRKAKPAKDIGLIDDKNDNCGLPDGGPYYTRTLAIVDDLVSGDMEQLRYEDFLRKHYLKKGWQLYPITDLLKSLCRLGGLCASQDTKEKTPDLVEQFYHDRESKETSFNTEINLRKQADKYIKDGELFLIRWIPSKNETTVQWIQKDETTFDLDDMERKERWQYYTSSFVRIEPTEGVNRGLLHKSVLTRNLPSNDMEAEDGAVQRKPLVWSEDLTLRICVNSSRIIFKEPGSEFFIYTDKPLSWDAEKNMAAARVRLEKAEESRNERFKRKWVNMSPWMKDLPLDEVQKISAETRKWIVDGVRPGTAPTVEGSAMVE